MNEWILRELELMLLTAVLIIGAVCIAKCFGHKIGYRWRKFLWLLIAIRLVIPAYTIEEYVEQRMVVERGFEEQGVAEQDIVIPIAQPSWSRVSQVSVLDDAVVDIDADIETNIETNIETEMESINLQKRDFRDVLENFLARYAQKIAGDILGIGVLLLLGMEVVQYVLYKNRYWKNAVVCKDENAIALWQQICRGGSRNKKKVPEIMICEHVASPMLMGYRKTVLLLPHTNYSEQEMTMMFYHEATHYRKKDLWYKLFLSIVCDLYWFNPLYRYMKKLAFQDVEYVCDELVTRDMNKEERYFYGQIILKTMTQTWQDSAAYTTQFAAGKRTAKNRLGLLFTGKHRKIGFAIVAVLVLGIVGISMHVSFVWQDVQMEEILTEDVHAEEVETEDVLQDVGMEKGILNAENIERLDKSENSENSDTNAYDFLRYIKLR